MRDTNTSQFSNPFYVSSEIQSTGYYASGDDAGFYRIGFSVQRSLPSNTADEIRPASFVALPLIAY